MKTQITYEDLRAMNPCYHPKEIGISSDYSATIPEFIKEYRDKVKSKEDILWVLCREEYMSEKDMRLFAVWCAREALKLVTQPDLRSINACDVAEKYANGEATEEELYAAGDAAGDAARAASGAAWAAAWAASAAARGSASAAAWTATCAAAWDTQIDKLLTYFE